MAAILQYGIQDSRYDKVKILELVGEIDESNQSQLENLMEELLANPRLQFVVINLERLEYINSGVIGYLAIIHGKYSENNKEFVFAKANEHIYDVIDLVGLTSVIECFEDIDDACESFDR